MAKREDYQIGKRIRDNTQHADTVRAYWLERGYHVNIRVCEKTGEIVSDMRNGLPRFISQDDINVAVKVPRDEIERIEREFLEIYDVTIEDVHARANKNKRPEAGFARNSIWHALHTELGMTHNAIAKRYNRARHTVLAGIRQAEGE